MIEKLKLEPKIEARLAETKLVFVDLDQTLAIAEDETYYDVEYPAKFKEAIAEYFSITVEQVDLIENGYKQAKKTLFHALFDPQIYDRIPFLSRENTKENVFPILYQKLNELDPTGKFKKRLEVKAQIQQLREQGVVVVLVTSSPAPLAEKVLIESGLTPDDFDGVVGFHETNGPEKITTKGAFYKPLAESHGLQPNAEGKYLEGLTIGDTEVEDLKACFNLGMLACLINENIGEFAQIVTNDLLNILFTLNEIKSGQ